MKLKIAIFKTAVLSIVVFVYLSNSINAATTITSNIAVDSAKMAIKGKLIFKEDFKEKIDYTNQYQLIQSGWLVKANQGKWEQTKEGIRSLSENGNMPALTYQGPFRNSVIELDFRFFQEKGKWAACRISPTNPDLNPRAYAASVWVNQNNNRRPLGMVLEHEEWKVGGITTVDNKPAAFESGKWYTIRIELIGDYVRASCNGVTVFGTQQKFGIPKNSISLGVGTCPHELRNFRVYAATPNPKFVKPQTLSIK